MTREQSCPSEDKLTDNPASAMNMPDGVEGRRREAPTYPDQWWPERLQFVIIALCG
jgi:hypothetical protein